MITLTNSQIREIAEFLDGGMKCYINIETGNIKSVLDSEINQSDDTEPWEDDIKELKENWDSYCEIKRMNSYESFKIMEDFVETVDATRLHDDLTNALSKKHPFQSFKWLIDNSGPYRQSWFDFRNQKQIDWVIDQLNNLGVK
jgi:hypothetical protein